MSAAFLATSVPVIPIANPTSAFLRAGASLVPSPVTATTSPNYFNPVTSKYLSSGQDQAKTHRDSLISANTLEFTTFSLTLDGLHSQGDFLPQVMQIRPPTYLKNSGPSIITNSFFPFITLSSSIILHSFAIAVAVIILSPVTILTHT